MSATGFSDSLTVVRVVADGSFPPKAAIRRRDRARALTRAQQDALWPPNLARPLQRRTCRHSAQSSCGTPTVVPSLYAPPADCWNQKGFSRWVPPATALRFESSSSPLIIV